MIISFILEVNVIKLSHIWFLLSATPIDNPILNLPVTDFPSHAADSKPAVETLFEEKPDNDIFCVFSLWSILSGFNIEQSAWESAHCYFHTFFIIWLLVTVIKESDLAVQWDNVVPLYFIVITLNSPKSLNLWS